MYQHAKGAIFLNYESCEIFMAKSENLNHQAWWNIVYNHNSANDIQTKKINWLCIFFLKKEMAHVIKLILDWKSWNEIGTAEFCIWVSQLCHS